MAIWNDPMLYGDDGGVLPEVYQQVEWIGSNGTQWINTGIQFAKQAIEFRMIADGYINDNEYVGTDWSPSYKMMYFNTFNNNWRFGLLGNDSYNSIAFTVLPFVDDVTVLFDSPNRKLTINGYEADIRAGGASPNGNILIGRRASSEENFRGKILYVRIGSDANFVPCYRKSDNVIGMYDLCGSICPLTGTPFFVNSGTGDFTKGPDV